MPLFVVCLPVSKLERQGDAQCAQGQSCGFIRLWVMFD